MRGSVAAPVRSHVHIRNVTRTYTRAQIRVRDVRQCGPEGAKHRSQGSASLAGVGWLVTRLLSGPLSGRRVR